MGNRWDKDGGGKIWWFVVLKCRIGLQESNCQNRQRNSKHRWRKWMVPVSDHHPQQNIGFWILFAHIGSLHVDFQHISHWVLFNVIHSVARCTVVVKYIINWILFYKASFTWRKNFYQFTISCCITTKNAAIIFLHTKTNPFIEQKLIPLNLKARHKYHNNSA